MAIRPVTVYLDPADATEFYERIGDLLKDPATPEKKPRKRRTPTTAGWQEKLDQIWRDNPSAHLATRQIVDLLASSGMYAPRRSVQVYLADRVESGFLVREGATPQHIQYRLNQS